MRKYFFYNAASMHGDLGQEWNVCLSVCLSVCPLSYTAWRNGYPSFLARRVVGGGDPFYLTFWVKLTHLDRKCRFSINIHL